MTYHTVAFCEPKIARITPNVCRANYNDIWPLCVISLPVLLLSQSRIRLAIKCKKSPKNIRATTCTIHQSSGASQPSDTYFSAQHENSVSRHTHGDCLCMSSSSIVGLLPARKMTARSSYGGRYNRLHGNLGREDTCKDGSLQVLVPSRSL